MKNARRALKDMLNYQNYHYEHRLSANQMRESERASERQNGGILNSSINKGWYT